jgi:hypothetical protein
VCLSVSRSELTYTTCASRSAGPHVASDPLASRSAAWDGSGVGNPPKVTACQMSYVAPKKLLHSFDNVVFLATLTHFVTRARLRDLADAGFGMREALFLITRRDHGPAVAFSYARCTYSVGIRAIAATGKRACHSGSLYRGLATPPQRAMMRSADL